MDLDRWGELARLRQGLYRFFATGFLPPDGDRLEALRSASRLLADRGLDAFSFAREWGRFVDDLDGADVHDLEHEHVRLFVAGLDEYYCSPLESDYLCSVPTQKGSVVAAISREYAAIGMAPDPSAHLAPDHVVTELEAMAVLCDRESMAREALDRPGVAVILRRQRTFLRRHLTRWFDAFGRRVGVCATTNFYPSLAVASSAFLSHERELLELLSRYEQGRAA